MKTALIPTFFALAGLGSLAQSGELTVTIQDLRTTAGTLNVAVVNSEAGWNDQAQPVAAQRLKVTGKEMVLTFTLPKGSYGVQVMHDENDNGKLDANFMGMPTEGYGFSNNPQVLRRARFDEAKFDVGDAPAAITIRLR